MEFNKRPLSVLAKLTSRPIIIKLKNGIEYHGIMEICDNYMNIVLSQAREYINGKHVMNYGTNVFIRGNNILYVTLEPPK